MMRVISARRAGAMPAECSVKPCQRRRMSKASREHDRPTRSLEDEFGARTAGSVRRDLSERGEERGLGVLGRLRTGNQRSGDKRPHLQCAVADPDWTSEVVAPGRSHDVPADGELDDGSVDVVDRFSVQFRHVPCPAERRWCRLRR